jgi:hypothetical protein
MKDKYEYWWDGRWVVCRDVKLRRRPDYNHLFIRQTTYYKQSHSKKQLYYTNNKYHRLDGPAQEYDNYYYEGFWYVNGIQLVKFDACFKAIRQLQSYNSSSAKIKKLIFDYAKEYPYTIKEIILLAKFNDWLNLKEIALLECMDLFK